MMAHLLKYGGKAKKLGQLSIYLRDVFQQIEIEIKIFEARSGRVDF